MAPTEPKGKKIEFSLSLSLCLLDPGHRSSSDLELGLYTVVALVLRLRLELYQGLSCISCLQMANCGIPISPVGSVSLENSHTVILT